MSGYLPHHREPRPDPLATCLAWMVIAALILCLVLALADAIDRTAPVQSLTDTQRKVVVDRWGEPQLVERLNKVQCE